jgi:hypothetical protein
MKQNLLKHIVIKTNVLFLEEAILLRNNVFLAQNRSLNYMNGLANIIFHIVLLLKITTGSYHLMKMTTVRLFII